MKNIESSINNKFDFNIYIHFNCNCELIYTPCKKNNMTEINTIPNAMQDKIFNCKSKSVYEGWQSKFSEYIKENDLPENMESIMLYFTKIAEKYSPSTLWQCYSCLNKFYTTFKGWSSFNDIPALKNFLKKLEKESPPKKQSNIIEKDQLFEFLNSASNDDKYVLLRKMVTIFGYYGGLRINELVNLQFDDVVVQNESMSVFIRQSKTDQNGKSKFYFTIPKLTESDSGTCCPFTIVKTYMDHVSDKNGRLFRNFNAKSKTYTSQPMGRNGVGAIPKYIATFLKLKDPESYTGHCFRRSSATALADTGVSSISLKRQFRWKSDTVAQSYIDQSKKSKADVANALSLNLGQSGSSSNSSKMVNITNCSNVIINL